MTDAIERFKERSSLLDGRNKVFDIELGELLPELAALEAENVKLREAFDKAWEWIDHEEVKGVCQLGALHGMHGPNAARVYQAAFKMRNTLSSALSDKVLVPLDKLREIFEILLRDIRTEDTGRAAAPLADWLAALIGEATRIDWDAVRDAKRTFYHPDGLHRNPRRG